MPNMRILALAVLKYRVDKVFMAESKTGHNFAIQEPTEKKTCSLIFCTDATHKISSSWLKPFSSFTTNNNAILVKSKKGHNPVNISRNSLKS